MNIAFPLQVSSFGATASVDDDRHIGDMLEQLIFTNPGERVNRPDFGSGLMQLVFAPNSPELAATLQFTLQAAVQQWLGDLIRLESLAVRSDEGMLYVDLQYVVLRTGASLTQRLTRSLV